jgi:hypothetical protein
MPSPHPGMHMCCPACDGPAPDLLGELTDDAAAINVGQHHAVRQTPIAQDQGIK